MFKPDHIVALCASGIHIAPMLWQEQKTWLAIRAKQHDNSMSHELRLVVTKKMSVKGGK